MKHSPLTDLLESAELIPEIFADGERDDGEGIVAAIMCRPVMFDGKVYTPEEDIVVDGRPVKLPGGLYVADDGDPADFEGYRIVLLNRPTARHVTIKNCEINVAPFPWPGEVWEPKP
jgi:hypothetical protein